MDPLTGPVWQSRVANVFSRKQIHSKARRLNASAQAFLYKLGSPGRWARAKLDDIQRNKRLRPKRKRIFLAEPHAKVVTKHGNWSQH